MARPTKYKKMYCKQLVEYFDVPPVVKEKETRYYQGSPYEVDVQRVSELPTFERFARSIGVSMSTLWEWRQAHKEFSNAYKTAQELQEGLIVQNSILGRYAGPFSQFYLKNKYSYVDQQHIDHTTKDQPIPLLAGLAPATLEVEDEGEDLADGGATPADDSSQEDQ